MSKRMRVFRAFEIKDRVIANDQARFHKGAHGFIEYITPTGEIWVRRDGTGSAIWYHAFELDFEDPEDGYCMSDKVLEKALAATNTTYRDFDDGARWAWALARKVFDKQLESQ